MDMRVKIAGVEWNNPVTVASGTFGSGDFHVQTLEPADMDTTDHSNTLLPKEWTRLLM